MPSQGPMPGGRRSARAAMRQERIVQTAEARRMVKQAREESVNPQPPRGLARLLARFRRPAS